MSNKNTNNRISYGQYKAADIVMFIIIMCLCETVNVLALKQWFSSPMFSISVMLLVSLVVMIRWGLIGVTLPMVDGLLYCALLGATVSQYVIYIIGNAFVALVWVILKVFSKEKVTSTWYFTLLYAIAGYAFLVLGRALVAICFGESFLSAMLSTLSGELLNFVFAVVGLLTLRKVESMLVDQKTYLLKVTEERDTLKPAAGEYWDGYTELNSEDLERLKAMDEYDSKIAFNRTSLKNLKENSGEYDAEPDSSDEDDLSRLDGE